MVWRREAPPAPPRYIDDAGANPLVITAWVLRTKLEHDFSVPLIDPKTKTVTRASWTRLWDHAVRTRYFEIVSLLRPGERWLPMHKAILRLPVAGLCAPQRIAEVITKDQARLLWKTLGSRPEVRLHFFGTAWELPDGYTRVPIVRLTPSRAEFDTGWVDNVRMQVENIWTENDLALLVVLSPPAAS